MAVVSAGTYFFRYLSMRLQIAAIRKKLPVAYDLEGIIERAEAEAFILAVGACVLALLNTLFVDYGWIAARLEKVGVKFCGIDRKTLLGAYAVFVWVLFGALSVNSMYPLLVALCFLTVSVWLNGGINKPGLFATSFLLVIVVASLLCINAAA